MRSSGRTALALVVPIINGHVTTILIDEDAESFRPSGLIGFGIDQCGLGRASVRDVWIRH